MLTNDSKRNRRLFSLWWGDLRTDLVQLMSDRGHAGV